MIYMQPGGRDIPGDSISRLTSSSYDTMYLCASLFSPWDGGCVALIGIMRAHEDFLHLLCSTGFFKILSSRYCLTRSLGSAMSQHHSPGWVGEIFSVALEDIQSCVMPSQRHRDNVLSLYFFSFSIFSIVSIFYFFVMSYFLFCAPTVFINACVGSLFFTIGAAVCKPVFSSRNRCRGKVANSSGHACSAHASEILPWNCMYHEKYSVFYALFVVFLLQLILRIDYTLYLLSLFQPKSHEPLLWYACIIL